MIAKNRAGSCETLPLELEVPQDSLVLRVTTAQKTEAMDTARSWVVALSCCWINIFTFFMYRVAATIYVGILDTFQVSREEASWPINLAIIFYCVLGEYNFDALTCYRMSAVPSCEQTKFVTESARGRV